MVKVKRTVNFGMYNKGKFCRNRSGFIRKILPGFLNSVMKSSVVSRPQCFQSTNVLKHSLTTLESIISAKQGGKKSYKQTKRHALITLMLKINLSVHIVF